MAEEAGSNYVDEIGSSQTRRIWDAFRAAERAEACHE
jgi:hypothetical protein